MKTIRRWCLNCFEDFAEDISSEGLCAACDYEHDRAMALGRIHFQRQNKNVAEWWGPTHLNVNPEDMAEGFYITSAGFEDHEIPDYQEV